MTREITTKDTKFTKGRQRETVPFQGSSLGWIRAKEVGMEFDALSNRVIGCALEVHRALGPGLLESSYEQCLAHELVLAKIGFEMQRPLPVEYKGIRLDCGYRVDVLVEDTLILELKAVEGLLPIHEAQLLTYLRLSGRRTGILINFNVELLKRGIKRMVL